MKSLLPGLAVCAVAATAAVLINLWVPVLSALLVAILLGMLVGNLTPLPQTAAPGVAYSSKRLLRIGVVLLGLQVSLGDIAGLGWGMVAVVDKNRPGEVIQLRYTGHMENHSNETLPNWSSALEIYRFLPISQGTKLSCTLQVDDNDECIAFFDHAWPAALQRLKDLCEQK